MGCLREMKDKIFLDLDGTLIDTSERHYVVFRDILKSYKIPIYISKDYFWNEKRGGRKTIELLPKGLPCGLIKKFSKEWINSIEKKEYLKCDKAFPGMKSILSNLYKKRDLILVTLRNNKKNLLWELNYFGITKFFKSILVDSPMKNKDKASMIKEILAKSFNNKSIIIGDTEVDMLTGKKLRILTIAATYGIRSKHFLEKLKPDFCIENPTEIIRILKKIKSV